MVLIMRKIEQEHNDPPKPKQKKKFVIYKRYTKEFWNDVACEIFDSNEWYSVKHYKTEKDRDKALESLIKNPNNNIYEYTYEYKYACKKGKI